MLKSLSAVALVAGVLALGACGDSSGPEAALTGTWNGNTAGIIMNLLLNEGDGGAVTGSGSISGEGPTASL